MNGEEMAKWHYVEEGARAQPHPPGLSWHWAASRALPRHPLSRPTHHLLPLWCQGMAIPRDAVYLSHIYT